MFALGAIAVAEVLPELQFPRPALFITLFALSVISSAMKVDMPVGVGAAASRSLRVDFTRCCCSTRSGDADRDGQRMGPVHVSHEGAQSAHRPFSASRAWP